MTESDAQKSGPVGPAIQLANLIEPEAYIGEIYSLNYDEALVRIRDVDRRKVGGIPALSFLVASRINPRDSFDVREEDSSAILLRVIDRAESPHEEKLTQLRFEAASKSDAKSDKFWEEDGVIEPLFQGILTYTAVRCRVLGTFYINEDTLCFGSDISNYYPNSALRVFKLRGPALEKVANFRRSQPDAVNECSARIGEVRYASTNRAFQGISSTPVTLTPKDLVNQRTALFGMTRTGKSNTTKVILKSIFDIRWQSGVKIGQLVFDPNGEYCNENVQDKMAASDVLRNIWREAPAGHKDSAKNGVVTYGTTPNQNDRTRKLLQFDFYSDENLQTGKDIIDRSLESDTSKYISNFRDVRFAKPEDSPEDTIHHRRRVLAYRTLLFRSGFAPSRNSEADLTGLFGQNFLKALADSKGDNSHRYKQLAEQLSEPRISWNRMARAIRDLSEFISDRDSGFREFDLGYIRNNPEQSSWADEDLLKIIEVFRYKNGPNSIARVKNQHNPDLNKDYAEEIYSELKKGSLVMIDQSSGHSELNEITSERIMERIFGGNRDDFTAGSDPKPILVYIEEAHNLLPPSGSRELSNVWVRIAKEGAKYHIGLVYATQEVSSIQRNVLRNTTNWFIGHLNNTDETKELNKFYDFADFEKSILRAEEKGFIRMKTLSNPYIVPVQIDRFTIKDTDNR